jgi:RND family efflux transporter MFP subunit
MSETKASLDDLKIDRGQRRATGGRRARWPWLLVVLAVAAAALWFWLRPGAAPEVATAVAREMSAGTGAGGGAAVLEASGYVTARRKATVSAQFTGKITEVLVEEGMRVAEGQVLARLDDALLRRQLALNEAQLTAARSQLAEIEVRKREAEITRGRTERLVAAEVSTDAQLDADRAAVDSLAARLAAARDDVEVAQRQVALQREQLEDSVIRAPFDGVAVSKDAQPGEMISPVSAGGGFTRTGICTLVDMASLEIEVDVNEAYIQRVSDGQRVSAKLDAYPDWTIPAYVITIVPTADRQKATMKVRIGFDQLDDPRILPDMGVKVAFLAPEQAPDAGGAAPVRRLLVPRQAVTRDGERDVVFVVNGERAERRAVSVGERRNDDVEITAGLVGGESVILDPPAELADGDRVRVREGS